MPLRHRPHRVIFVPLDDRPCSVKMPRLLARMVDFELIMPPLELLGQGQTPGDPESIGEWLLEQLRETADCAVVSLDMLAYGGLAASCTSSIRTQLAQERLEILRRIRSAAPSTPIYASSSIMRLAIATSSDAAARYWDAVRRYAVVSAHATQIEPSQAAVERERLEREIPGSILGEYLAIRARNHEINQRAVSEVAAGNVDFLLLCQGPAGGEGVHLDEQQELDRTIAEGHVVNRAVTCEGTDHAGTLLLARFIHTHMQKVPSVRVVYSTDEDADVMPPLESGTLSE